MQNMNIKTEAQRQALAAGQLNERKTFLSFTRRAVLQGQDAPQNEWLSKYEVAMLKSLTGLEVTSEWCTVGAIPFLYVNPSSEERNSTSNQTPEMRPITTMRSWQRN